MLLLIITLGGLFLRLYKLGYHDFWYDEAISLLLSQNYERIWDPPLFLIITHSWTKLFGCSEFIARLPSVIFNTLSIPLIFLFGRKLFNKKVGIFSALLLALSPFQLWYAQEIRHYSLSLFFGLLSTYFLIMVIQNKPKYWLYFTLSSAAAFYSGEFHIFLLITQILIISLFLPPFNNKKARRNLLIFLILMAGFLPWGYIYFRKAGYIMKGFWLPRPDLSSLVITFENFLAGYNLKQSHYFLVDILILLMLGSGYIKVSKDRLLKNNFYMVLFLLLFPILSIYAFSRLVVPIYLDRALIIFSPYLYIALAAGMNKLLENKFGLLVCSLVLSIFVLSLNYYYQDLMPTEFKHHLGTYIKKPVKPLIEFVEENLSREDIIGFSNHSTLPCFELYSKQKTNEYYRFFDPKLLNTDTKRPFQESYYNIPKHKIPGLKAARIWLIASNWWHDGNLDEQSESVKRYLDEKMNLIMQKNIEGVKVYIYK